jgi:hypothetical protein
VRSWGEVASQVSNVGDGTGRISERILSEVVVGEGGGGCKMPFYVELND